MLSLRGLHISIPLTVILRCAVLKFFEHGTEIVAGGKPEGICQIRDTDVSLQKLFFGILQFLQGNIFCRCDAYFVLEFEFKMREGITGDIHQILQVHGFADILVQPGYGSGDIGIEAVDIAVIDGGEKLQAEQKTDEELGSDLDGPGRHIAEEVEGGAQILDMCISRLKMTVFKI